MKISQYIEYKLKKFNNYWCRKSFARNKIYFTRTFRYKLGRSNFKKNLTIKKKQILQLEKIFDERKNRKPLSRIFQKAYFRDIKLFINEHTFSPRIDSEVLIDILVKQKIYIRNILELGTGTGALSISLLKHFKSAKSIVTDISKEAIYIAKKNAILNSTDNQMQYICCDWLSCFKNLNFDILISNPPYIKRSEIELLDDEVKKYDPLISLDGGHDGLAAYRKILNSIKKIGCKNLFVLFEIGL